MNESRTDIATKTQGDIKRLWRFGFFATLLTAGAIAVGTFLFDPTQVFGDTDNAVFFGLVASFIPLIIYFAWWSYVYFRAERKVEAIRQQTNVTEFPAELGRFTPADRKVLLEGIGITQHQDGDEPPHKFSVGL